jgi:hypothetical protein
VERGVKIVTRLESSDPRSRDIETETLVALKSTNFLKPN